MISALDIAASGLAAQRTRITAISNNIANMSTTRNEAGRPEAYQPRFVVFETDDSVGNSMGAAGVRVSSVETANVQPRISYQPNHPDAVDGYVEFPDINMMAEFTDAIEASRAYEANVGVIEITKNMAQQTLRILA